MLTDEQRDRDALTMTIEDLRIERNDAEQRLDALAADVNSPEAVAAQFDEYEARLAKVKSNWEYLAKALATARKEIAGRKEHGEKLKRHLDHLADLAREAENETYDYIVHDSVTDLINACMRGSEGQC